MMHFVTLRGLFPLSAALFQLYACRPKLYAAGNELKPYLHLQMLLCVGSFFNDTPECQEQWKEYVEGREKGKEKLILVPILAMEPLLKDIKKAV